MLQYTCQGINMQQPFTSSVKPTRHKRWHARPFLICHGQTWPNQRGGSRGGAASSGWVCFYGPYWVQSSQPITHHSVLLIHLLGWSLCCCWFTMLPLCNWVAGDQTTGPRSPSSNPSNSALCVCGKQYLTVPPDHKELKARPDWMRIEMRYGHAHAVLFVWVTQPLYVP